MSTVAVRQHLIDALIADLVGPFSRAPRSPYSDAPEVLELAPSRWYLTGFLAPREQALIEDDPTEEEDEPEAGDQADQDDEPKPDPAAKRPRRLPASIGLSALLPEGTASLTARVCWADYVRLEPARLPDGKRPRPEWSRVFRPPVDVKLSLDAKKLREGADVPGSKGLRLEGRVEKMSTGDLAVSVFLVNARAPIEESSRRDESYAFQVLLELEAPAPFLGRENRSDEGSDDPDELLNDLQYRAHSEYAVGHGVATEAHIDSDGKCRRVATSWIPQADVHPVVARPVEGVVVSMDALGAIADGDAAKQALSPLVDAYRAWISAQRKASVGDGPRAHTQKHLMGEAERAASRIAEGIALLGADPRAFEAFRLMNRAMAEAERRAGRKDPAWRLFQLAFILLNLASMTDAKHADRRRVELIFFPTGGGKTQAYLGLIAFTLLRRRLLGANEPHGGLGVAVLLRYTLRLLTLDQLARAATLVCALELLRRQEPNRLGDERFSIGLWVGRSATANRLSEVAEQITEYKNQDSANAPSPAPLSECPWCKKELTRDSLQVLGPKKQPTDVVLGCVNYDDACPFSFRQSRDGLPVLFVDEQIYRELPGFLVATVDKFALLPWRGETGMLMGRALARSGRRFYGPCDDTAARRGAAVQLPNGVPRLELVVQDELHLISGPLGSMVGLFESALLTLNPEAKVIASTATVRRAPQQVQRLYGRDVAVFPPTGIDASETFFGKVDRAAPARRYLAVAAPGRPMKTVLLRTYVALLTAALQRSTGENEDPADPYLTLVGYFNSLRELGGMRRLVDDEVRKRMSEVEKRRPKGFDPDEPHPWAHNRERLTLLELTSREKTTSIKDTKARLEKPAGEQRAVDVLLASNMISVGVDIDRLGLMVIAGQPKTTSEYIQASSRVGRKAEKPGLVVTCLNLAKPRDRSHYERFAAYHACFYRFVEATSVTPFSGPALDRGLPAVVVALARLYDAAMTAPTTVMEVEARRKQLDQVLDAVAQRAGAGLETDAEQKKARDEVRARIASLVDAWVRIVADAKKNASERAYSPLDPSSRGVRALLRTALDDLSDVSTDELKFIAPLSMRDVESSVHVWVKKQPLGGYRPPKPEGGA